MDGYTAKLVAALILILPMSGAYVFNAYYTYNVYIIEDEGNVLSFNQEVLMGSTWYNDGKNDVILNGIRRKCHIINNTENEFTLERIVYGNADQSWEDIEISSFSITQVDIPKIHYLPYDEPPTSVKSNGSVEVRYYLKQD